ncbi:SMP-30/gluconolactonase/LRE family protein [Cellvibrio japonicus]|uniref:Gluconolactonase n=1 Tax=Cellvibrio japonicus (strain Ueda107) TaxID=498211 RepID=B3PHK0_CELJU|nr:SMP-30/gluconolactonase/LRE family protein [Cellvibrio japonicus]ACE86150.1 gluconolactonase precursor [Cellvibrio japonicus Ueda107]QEI12475.1 SMP-30/gluconolactonase/LRE family protein [Cellvibrio japonicus]QEI16049.1 SMP-30/gluconolactonase/LRE family protein [Cellvibrio japonicus]QEI19627.1 SMP-30/gluconolactonase/LRE family protein [Cellvibrio japonicus]
MKNTLQRKNYRLTSLCVSILCVVALSGCQRDEVQAPVDNYKADSTPSAAVSPADSTCGAAPQGELVAQRIDAANSTRSEPGLYEGPVWIGNALYFSDFTFSQGFPSRVQKLDMDGTLTTVIEDSGSNGLAVDLAGDLLAGTHKYKSVSRFNLLTGERTSVAEAYQGNVFNSPNDLVLANDGSLYFTDPAFQRDAAPGGQEKTSVYRVDLDGTVTLVDDTISNPNGISLSPAQDVLYVNGGGEQGILRAYPMVDGYPQAGNNLVEGLVIPDGMAVDCHGNIYVTEHTAQRLRVFSPSGEQLALIKTDANVTNAAFGGPEGKTLYLTGAGAVWKVELSVTGSPY